MTDAVHMSRCPEPGCDYASPPFSGLYGGTKSAKQMAAEALGQHWTLAHAPAHVSEHRVVYVPVERDLRVPKRPMAELRTGT